MNEKSVEEKINEFNEENDPFYIVDHDNKKYSLCLCFLYADGNYCQEAFDNYARERGEPTCDAQGFYTHGSGYDWEAAFKKVFENDERLKDFDFDSENDGFFCDCYDLDTVIDFGKRFRAICEDTEKFTPIVSQGIKDEERRRIEEERRREEEKQLLQTVRGQLKDKLKKNPTASFDIRYDANDGFYVKADEARKLLDGTMESITSDDGVEISAESFLNMRVAAIQKDLFSEDFYQVKVEREQAELLSPEMKMGG